MTESGHIPDDATPIFHEIDNQSDRAAAVVAGSFVERALQIAIEAEWHIPSKYRPRSHFYRQWSTRHVFRKDRGWIRDGHLRTSRAKGPAPNKENSEQICA